MGEGAKNLEFCERAWDQPELQRFLLDITLILIYTAFIRDLFRLRRMTPFHATKHTYNNITKSGLSRRFAAESSIVSPRPHHPPHD